MIRGKSSWRDWREATGNPEDEVGGYKEEKEEEDNKGSKDEIGPKEGVAKDKGEKSCNKDDEEEEEEEDNDDEEKDNSEEKELSIFCRFLGGEVLSPSRRSVEISCIRFRSISCGSHLLGVNQEDGVRAENNEVNVGIWDSIIRLRFNFMTSPNWGNMRTLEVLYVLTLMSFAK